MTAMRDFRAVGIMEYATSRRFDTEKRVCYDCLLLRTPSSGGDGGAARHFSAQALADVARLVKTERPIVKVLHDSQASLDMIRKTFPNGELAQDRKIGMVSNGQVAEGSMVRGDFAWLSWADDALAAILDDPDPAHAWAFSMHGTGLASTDADGTEHIESVKAIKSIDLVPAAASGARGLWESRGEKKKPEPLPDAEYAAAVRDALGIPLEKGEEPKPDPLAASYLDVADTPDSSPFGR